jgi:hypothetical protein
MVFNMPPINSGSGGANLGTASGALRIDTSDLKNAVGMVRQSVQSINNEMAKAGQGAKSAMQTARMEIQKVQGLLTGITAAGAGFIAVGLKWADQTKAARIQFKHMLGDVQKADALMVDLNKKANEYRISSQKMVTIARSLLPALKGNTEELDRYTNLTLRLYALKPEQGIEGAIYALKEAQSGNLRSLAARYEFNPAEIRALAEETGDWSSALDALLNRAGMTTEAIKEMGDTAGVSLQQVKSLIAEILGKAMEPLLNNFVVPALQGFRDLLTELSENHQGFLQLAGGVVALVTAGSAALLTFAKLAKTLEVIKTLSIAPQLGKLGIGAGVVAAGVGAGLLATRAYGKATGNEQLANANLQSVIEVLKQTAVVFASMLQPAGRALGELAAIVMVVGAQVKDGFGRVIEALAGFVTGVGEALHIQALQDAGAGLQEWAEGLKLTNKEREELAQKMQNTRDQVEQFGKGLGEAITQALYPQEPVTAGGGGAGTTGPTDQIDQFAAEQVAAWGEFQDDLKTIEEQAQTDRLAATEQFEKQRADVEESYQKTLRRMGEDYAIEDRRRADNRAKQLAGVATNRDKQIEAETQSYNERITEIQADAHERGIQAQKDYQKRRRELQLELGKSLLKSAARLDALGVIAAIEKYNEQNRKEAESYNESQQQQAEQLAQRLEQEQESHEERIQLARDAATQQLADLRDRYAEEDRLRIEDRALRLRRMEEDHREQLNELERTHQERLTQINNHETQERNAREQAFVQQFNSLAQHEGQMLDVQKEGQEAMAAELRRWWERQQEMIADTRQQEQSKRDRQEDFRGGDNYRGQYQTGGRVYGTGLYKLHQGEEVIRPDVAAAVRRMMGGSLNQNALVGALSGGGGPQIGSISIPIYAQPGMDEKQIAKIAVGELIRQLGEI